MKKYHSLIDKVYSISNLSLAFRNGSKRGGSPGPDGVTWIAYADKLTDNLAALSDRLRDGTFVFREAKCRVISTHRQSPLKIYISDIEDRIVQHALKQVLTRILEPCFLNVSYGYRKRRGLSQAYLKLTEMLKTLNDPHFFSLDIQKCFASMNRARLKEVLCRYVADGKAIALTDLAIGIKNGEGLPPGNVLSTLMADLYFLDADKHLADSRMIRYCDNIIGFSRSSEELVTDMTQITETINSIGLQLNANKTKVIYPVSLDRRIVNHEEFFFD